MTKVGSAETRETARANKEETLRIFIANVSVQRTIERRSREIILGRIYRFFKAYVSE